MPNEQRELVEGWRRGEEAEEAAVRALFGWYFPRAVRIGALSGLTLDEANDCAQETFVHPSAIGRSTSRSSSAHTLLTSHRQLDILCDR